MSEAIAMSFLPCYCGSIRQLSRVVTTLYNNALAGCDLKVTQFTILLAIEKLDSPTTKDLADRLLIDGTTLSRTLATLMRDGLVQFAAGADAREKHWSLSGKGRERLAKAVPCWEAAQASLRSKLGESALADLIMAVGTSTQQLAGITGETSEEATC